MNKTLLIQFRLNASTNCDLRVRALPVYSTADSLNQPVQRCALHMLNSDPQRQGGFTCLLFTLATNPCTNKTAFILFIQRPLLNFQVNKLTFYSMDLNFKYYWACEFNKWMYEKCIYCFKSIVQKIVNNNIYIIKTIMPEITKYLFGKHTFKPNRTQKKELPG